MSTTAPADLLSAALEAQKHAHAPYSDFKVGAAVRDEHGHIHAGCNVENASFPNGQCAEATAIGSLIASGSTQIREVLIVAGGPEAITPCGSCRQMMSEFMDPTGAVSCCDETGALRLKTTIGKLLPHQFSSTHLAEE